MNAYVALLRAVNVGGTGKLPMRELVAMCEDAGFAVTYIASGNVVFRSSLDGAGVRQALGERLKVYAGKPVGVLVRSANEIAGIGGAIHFRRPGNRVVALFLAAARPPIRRRRDRPARRTARTRHARDLHPLRRRHGRLAPAVPMPSKALPAT